ncbi:MAG: cell envelope integrity EipB family protein [Pseudorhodoplanes sp.]
MRSAILTAGILAIGVGVAGTAPGRAGAEAAITLSPHRAVYDLKLAQTRGKRAVEAVRGRILYDFAGNACEGYALQFRQVSEIDAGEGKVMLSDLRATTWEEGAAKSFRFNSQNFVNDQLVDAVDGSAERGASDTGVSLIKPGEKKFSLEGAIIFPTEHIRRIIAAAREGKTILELSVFDGSENGEKVYETLSVIGPAIGPESRKPGDAAASEPSLENLTRWPVTISYFDKSQTGGEQTPVYAITFELYENGISRALTLDYNDFVVTGEMTKLEVKPAAACP